MQDVATDAKSQEVVNSEVIAFMAENASVTEDDITALEERIKGRLMGNRERRGLAKRHGKDEWTRITEYKAKSDERKMEEDRKRTKEKQQEFRAELEQQIEEQNKRREMERAAKEEERKRAEEVRGDFIAVYVSRWVLKQGDFPLWPSPSRMHASTRRKKRERNERSGSRCNALRSNVMPNLRSRRSEKNAFVRKSARRMSKCGFD